MDQQPLPPMPPVPVKTSSKAKPWLILAGFVLVAGAIGNAMDKDKDADVTVSGTTTTISTDCVDLQEASRLSDSMSSNLTAASAAASSGDAAGTNDALDRVVDDAMQMVGVMEPDPTQRDYWNAIASYYTLSRDAAADGNYNDAILWMNKASAMIDQSAADLTSSPPTGC